jgi:hypothetical protein
MPDWINPVIDAKSVANVVPLAMLPAIITLNDEAAK